MVSTTFTLYPVYHNPCGASVQFTNSRIIILAAQMKGPALFSHSLLTNRIVSASAHFNWGLHVKRELGWMGRPPRWLVTVEVTRVKSDTTWGNRVMIFITKHENDSNCLVLTFRHDMWWTEDSLFLPQQCNASLLSRLRAVGKNYTKK